MRKLSQSISNFYIKYGPRPSDDKRISELTYKISIILLITGVCYSIVFLLIDQPLLSILGWGISAGLFACYPSYKQNYYLFSKLGLIVITNFAVLFYAVALGKKSGISIFFFALVGIPFLIFHFRELKWIKFGAFLSVFLWIISEYQPFPPFVYFNESYLEGIEVLTGGMTFFILLSGLISYLVSNEFYKIKSGLSVIRLERINRKLEAALIREHEKALKIEEQAQKIEADAEAIREKQIQEKLLKQAGNYQTVLYQEDIPQFDRMLIDVFGSASHYISGDYRYVFKVNETTAAIVVLDVTGHGAPAAMMTGILSKIVDDLLETSDPALLMDTGATMQTLNRTLCRERRLSKFIAGSYVVIDAVTHRVHFTCAGAESPMIYRNGVILPLKNCNESLRMDEEGRFDSVSAAIQPGDLIIVCTDGLMDRKLKDGEALFPTLSRPDEDEDAGHDVELDYARFESISARCPKDGTTAECIGELLENSCLPASDDMTIVVIAMV